MKLTPEEEIIFDQKYQELIEAYEMASDWLIAHKQDMKNVVEKVKDVISLGGIPPLSPPLRPRSKPSGLRSPASHSWNYKIKG